MNTPKTWENRSDPGWGTLPNKHDQQEIIYFLADLPPWDVLQKCTTDDQQQRILNARGYYSHLAQALEQYFSGQGNQFDDDLPPHMVEDLLNARDRWLTFYTAIQYCWNEFYSRLVDTFKPEALEHFGELLATPGAILLLCIEQQCVLTCAPAFERWYRWTPHEGRETLKHLRKRNQLLNSRNLTKPQKHQLSRAENYLKPKAQWIRQYSWLYDLCLGIATDVQKQTKDRRLKRYLKDLGEADGRQWALVEKNVLATRAKFQGVEWRNGDCTPMGKYGGVAQKPP